MRSTLFVPRRYQIKKETVQIVLKGHPWIFRDKLSSAAEAFSDGQWLKLVDAQNTAVGYGMYETEGLVAIRVLKLGPTAPTKEWIKALVLKALSRRENLRKYTDSFRALHGENDGLPAIVFDVYDRLGVLQTYSPSVDSLGRYVAVLLRKELDLRTVVWKPPAKRKGSAKKKDPAENNKILFGPPQTKAVIREGKLSIHVDAGVGQKSGAFLDLRNLRKWLTLQKLKGAKVLNLFSYTGTLGLAAEIAGAREIWNVDISKGALETAQKRHAIDKAKYRSIQADVFDWIKKLDPSQKFDVIIVDPPQMARLTIQVPQALKAYRRLYSESLSHLKKGGLLIGCCCTSRISRSMFEKEMHQLTDGKLKLIANLKSEEDHPVSYPEGDYLKVLAFR